MQITNYILFIIIFLACNNKVKEKRDNGSSTLNADSLKQSEVAFDKVKWSTKDDGHYPYRDIILDDLMSSHVLDSLKEKEVIDLLGQPDRIDSNYLFYTVSQKRIGFVPLHTKTMVVKFSADTIEWVRIHE